MFLVEDSSDDEILSLRAIQKCGVPCDVLVVRSGNEAMAKLLSPEDAPPELIVLDFHLPDYNGLEILRSLRKQEKFRYVPIVMLSAQESDGQFCDCLEEGANSCVQKPTDPGEFVADVSLLVKYWLTVHRSLAGPSFQDSHDQKPATLPTVAIIRGAITHLNTIQENSI